MDNIELNGNLLLIMSNLSLVSYRCQRNLPAAITLVEMHSSELQTDVLGPTSTSACADKVIAIQTICAGGRHNMPPPPLQVDNIFVFIRQVAPVPAYWLFKTSATS